MSFHLLLLAIVVPCHCLPRCLIALDLHIRRSTYMKRSFSRLLGVLHQSCSFAPHHLRRNLKAAGFAKPPRAPAGEAHWNMSIYDGRSNVLVQSHHGEALEVCRHPISGFLSWLASFFFAIFLTEQFRALHGVFIVSPSRWAYDTRDYTGQSPQIRDYPYTTQEGHGTLPGSSHPQ